MSNALAVADEGRCCSGSKKKEKIGGYARVIQGEEEAVVAWWNGWRRYYRVVDQQGRKLREGARGCVFGGDIRGRGHGSSVKEESGQWRSWRGVVMVVDAGH